MKTTSNDSRRCPENTRRHLLRAALFAVALFGSACDSTEVTTFADGGWQVPRTGWLHTGGAGGHSAGSAGAGGHPAEASNAGFTVGTVCIGNADCATGFCVDGVCCDTACTGSCQSCSLTGKIGLCAPVSRAHDDTCTGASTCDPSGNCRKDVGETCSGASDCATGNCVDGVCCSSANCGTCLSCGIAGSLGSCAPIPALKEDADSGCTGAKTCNGFGECRAKNGQSCEIGAECSSHSCVDGICCETVCTGTCYSCNQTGKEGTCAPLVGAEDYLATRTCSVSSYCGSDQVGAPVCLAKLADGAPCTFPYECPDNFCGTYYRDTDGDGYGAEPVTACGHQAPQGTVREGGDCCDTAADTHPNVTTFSPTRNACKSFDFNCDGLEEKQSVGTAKCGSGTYLSFPGVEVDDNRIRCR